MISYHKNTRANSTPKCSHSAQKTKGKFCFLAQMEEKMKTYGSKEMKRFNYLLGEIDAAYHEASLQLGLSDSAMQILYTICDNGDRCLLKTICRYSGLSKQTVNSAIRKLEREGIVYLESAGPKTKMVCLTEEGKQLAAKTAIQLLNTENEIFASWTKEEVHTYLSLTEKFLTDFKKITGQK